MLHFQVAMHQARLYKPRVPPLSCSYRLFKGLKSYSQIIYNPNHVQFSLQFFPLVLTKH